MDRARCITTPVDLQMPVEPARFGASNAIALRPPAWIEPAPSAHRSTCRRLHGSNPSDPLPARRSICSRRHGPSPLDRQYQAKRAARSHRHGSSPLHHHTGRPAAACKDRVHMIRCQRGGRFATTGMDRARSIGSSQRSAQPASTGMDRARSIGTPVDLQPPVEPARFAASNAIALQPPEWIEPAASAHRSTCSRLHGSNPPDPLPAKRSTTGMDRAHSI